MNLPEKISRLPALIVLTIVWGLSVLAMAIVLIMEHGFGLLPCQMCLWQRIPHYVVIGVVPVGAFILHSRYGREGGLVSSIGICPWTIALMALAVVYVVGSGLGIWHAGVEWGWWPGLSTCGGGGNITHEQMLSAMRGETTMPSCSEAAWRMAGISLAGYNAILSSLVAFFLTFVSVRKVGTR